ncbi:hypothetical protein BXO88_12045 [Oribacterium sp. C9]|uniref:hypothetical protein n=1 Tax=Oribacterium sp. C9 TaxID=1943579 RepID=UPI0009902972|nr:hypothetical protein [Oribacterium sp. C9]OON85519.1 hypothetical protein BXO88_12045 [Oribacterium sp. C9]
MQKEQEAYADIDIEVNDMLNAEKIRLMTQLSIYERKEGKEILETSRHFKGDYISRRLLTSAIYYTLCFILIAIVLTIINLEEVLLQLNIPFIMESLQSILYIYLIGMVIMLFLAYVRYNAKYDLAHRKSLFYAAKLDKLLRMQENDSDILDIDEDESEYYKETGGKIRIYDDKRNTWETVKPKFHTIVKRGGREEELDDYDSPDIRYTPIRNDTYRSDEPKGGWLDYPIDRRSYMNRNQNTDPTPKGGWLDEDLEDDYDDGLDILSIRKKDK